MTQNVTLPEQNTTHLTRSERLHLRNQSILTKLATGTTKENLQNEYNLSKRHLNKIIAQAEMEAEEWYKELPKKRLLQLFQSTAEKIQQKINRMEYLAAKFKDTKEEFDYDERIMHAYSNFMRLLSDGPGLVRMKEALEIMETYAKNHIKDFH